ncbi:MAG: phage shock protein PspC (stress-responsive transcriptional regulator), partial [Flavobacteriales bacterium]
MNKTLSVNIGGYIFNIEEDAYTQLRNYLDSISSYFAGQEGSDEIISDIEARIAELFNERLGTDRQVVINDDVEQVIIIMGKPEQYAEAEEDTQTSSKSKSNDNRRFYRDLDNSMIGGVCSGFSHHLGWDPVILRALFVLLLFTSIGIPLYIILWILIPAASSTAEKLKMKGQKINVENISKKINEEMDNVKSKFSSEGKTEGSKSVNKLIAGLGEFFSFIASFLRVVLGVLFLMLGIGMLIGFVIAIGGFSSGIPGNPELSISFLQDYIFFNPHMLSLAIIAAILLLVAPFLYFIYLGVRLLLRIQPPVKGVGIILLGMFILGSILASIAAINQAKEFNSEERIAIRQPQTEFASDTLIIR